MNADPSLWALWLAALSALLWLCASVAEATRRRRVQRTEPAIGISHPIGSTLVMATVVLGVLLLLLTPVPVGGQAQLARSLLACLVALTFLISALRRQGGAWGGPPRARLQPERVSGTAP